MFKLNIECTKDFDELHIIFSDGTSTVVTNGRDESKSCDKPSKHKEHKIPKHQPPTRNEALLDTDSEWGSVSQDVVQKPIIDDISHRDRPIKVAEELQNLDI